MSSSTLLTSEHYIETPFIWVEVGGVTFGQYLKTKLSSNIYLVDYPNVVKSLTVKRLANSATNTYTLELEYAVQKGADPNMIEKIFSKAASRGRKMYISYGDMQAFDYAYKKEECLILSIKPNVDIASAKINYTVKAQSTSYQQSQKTYYFPATTAKPSDEIIRLLSNKQYGLQDIFTGLQNVQSYSSLVASDDKVVSLKSSTETVLGRIKYLVSCMESADDSTGVKKSIYRLGVYDDTTALNGPYLAVKKFSSNSSNYVADVEINIGYPLPRSIVDFNVEVSEDYSILYEYTGETSSQTAYIDDNGAAQYQTNVVTPTNRSLDTQVFDDWWSLMVSFPITATLEMRGLLRAITLLDTILVNVYFWGQKHIYSGIYGITSQTDTISQSGYRTKLELLRMAGTEYGA